MVRPARFAALVILAASCSGSRGKEPSPNVLLITADTLRADRLGCYGRTGAETPHLDALARSGVLFEQAVTPVPLTLPAHVSLFTATYPARHGVTSNGAHRLLEEATTLAERLRDAGYATGAVVAAFPLDGRFGLAQGFEHYDDDLEGDGGPLQRERRARAVTESGLTWLRGRAKPPWFLWLHYFDPHAPYDPPEPFDRRFAGDLYDGEVAYLDASLGPIFEALRREGAGSRTLVAFTSDHGEGLGEHDEPYHGLFLYDTTIRVPLLLSLPGSLPEGARIASQVRLIDVVPTLLEILGLSPLPEAQGRSLLPTLEGEPDRPALLETRVPEQAFGAAALAALRTGRFKWIDGRRPELYDLRADPNESRNLAGSLPEEGRRLREGLLRLQSITASRPWNAATRDLTSEESAALRALGYAWVGADAPAGVAPTDRLDLGEVFEGLRLAAQAIEAGERAQAGAILEEVGEAAAWNPSLARLFLELVERAGDPRQAVRWAARFREVHPRSAPFWIDHAWALLRDGRPAQAWESAAAAARLDPCAADARAVEGTALLSMGMREEAQAAFRLGIELSPDFAEGAVHLARYLFEAGEPALAQEWLRAAIEERPSWMEPRRLLAAALAASGRRGEAVAALRALLEDGPEDAGLAYDAAREFHRLGAIEEAEVALRRTIRLQPRHAGARTNLGAILLSMGAEEEALLHFDAALATEPASVPARTLRAQAFEALGRTDRARADWEEILRRHPDHALARSRLGR